VLILHIFAFSVPSIKADYHRNSWNFIREKRYAFCRRHLKSKKMLPIRSHRGPTSLHVQHSIIVMLCRFLSRWKHVDDQSEQRVGVVVSVLRFAIALRPSHNMTTTRRRCTSVLRCPGISRFSDARVSSCLPVVPKQTRTRIVRSGAMVSSEVMTIIILCYIILE